MSEQKLGVQRGALGTGEKAFELKIEKLFDQVKKCASNYPNIYKIVLFGSRARGVYSDSEIPSARSNRPSVTIELTHLNER